MDKQALLRLLANNQLDELIYTLKNQHGIYNDLVLLESQWNDLRAKQRNGILTTEQANLEIARLRKNLLELIEIASGQGAVHLHPPTKQVPVRNRFFVAGAAVGLVVLIAVYFAAAPSGAGPASKTVETPSIPARQALKPAPAKPEKLDVSQARPITIAPGDFQYERVYSIVKTSVESIGGGKSLITLTVGLNFKGIINCILGTEKFRLIADELPGPLAPANYLCTVVDSKSYAEGDIKFELGDDVSQFSVVLEGKEDKIWHFSR